MILKLGMKHQAMELYKICINHDPEMTLTFLRQGQLRPPMHLNGKIGKCHLMAKNLLRMSKWTEDFETWHEASSNGALQSLYKS